MDYLEGLRNIILNELNIGGQEVKEENDDDDGDQNFMDDDDNTPAEEPASAEDAPAPDEEGDDTSDDGDQNFMDDDGGGDDAPAEDAPTDDGSSDDGDQNFMDDDSGEGDTSDTGEEPASDDGSTEDDGDQNFMDDGGEGGDSAEGGGDDSGSEEAPEDGDNQQEGEEQPEGQDYDINKIEDELFSSLTPEQIAIKNHELKDQFIELYSIIGSTLVRINDISKSNENINVLKFITEKLLELREMIDFNITTAYQTRTYIENNIIYQQCIATLNAIADIIDNIPKLDGRDEDEEEEDKNGISVEDDDEEEVKALDVSDTSVSNYQEESTDYNSLF